MLIKNIYFFRVGGEIYIFFKLIFAYWKGTCAIVNLEFNRF